MLKIASAWVLLWFVAYSEQQLYRNHRSFIDDAEYSMTCNCSWPGRAKISTRFKIVGGQDARKYYPMLAGLMYEEIKCSFCGGTILTQHHVLTAAHCVIRKRRMFLSVGRITKCVVENDGGQLIPIMKTPVIHSKYNTIRNHYDIAVVLTEQKIKFTDDVGPACVTGEPLTVIKDPLRLIGWGVKAEGSKKKTHWLQEVDLNMIDLFNCSEKVPSGWINKGGNQLCTYSEGKDACQGDSGGPLFWYNPDLMRLVQVALVSMGRGCARTDMPGVNTALYPFHHWIDYAIKKSTELFLPELIGEGLEVCKVNVKRRH